MAGVAQNDSRARRALALRTSDLRDSLLRTRRELTVHRSVVRRQRFGMGACGVCALLWGCAAAPLLCSASTLDKCLVWRQRLPRVHAHSCRPSGVQ